MKWLKKVIKSPLGYCYSWLFLALLISYWAIKPNLLQSLASFLTVAGLMFIIHLFVCFLLWEPPWNKFSDLFW